MSRLRVAYLVPSFPQTSEVFIAYEIAELSKRADVLLVALAEGPAIDHPVLENDCFKAVRYAGINNGYLQQVLLLPSVVLRHGLFSNSLVGSNLIGYRAMVEGCAAISRCLEFMRGFKPDVVHAHFGSMAQYANVLSEALGVPYTMMVHGSDVRRDYRYRPADLGLQRTSALVCTTPAVQAAAISSAQVPAERIHIIPIGVDTDLFKPSTNQDPRKIVAVGRLHPVKGFDTLIEAAKLLRESSVEYHLDIIGEGPQRSELESLIESYGLKSQIQLCGEVSHQQLPGKIASAGLCAIPSREEGFGTIVLEALSCKVPVLASAVDGLRFSVRETYGWFAEPENPASWAERLEQLLQDSAQLELKGQIGRRYVQENYSWTAQADRLEQMWTNSVLRASQSAPSVGGV